MSCSDKRLVSLAAFQKRVQGFVKDGYRLQFKAFLPTSINYKMVHRNGNRVLLTLNLKTYEISQL